MKTPITTLILLATLSLNVFAQQEIPMFFDNDLMLQTNASSEVAYSPDGSKIATVFGGGKIAVWDSATGRVITRLTGHSDQSTNIINGIVFSPNGRQLASCSWYGSAIKIWDTATGALIRSITQAGMTAVSFSPDGSRIVGAYSKEEVGNGIKIWNTANGSEIRTLVGHTDYIWSVRYSPDGRQILTASKDNSIRIWDAGNGQTLRTINDEAAFGDAVYSPDGRYIATRVYNINSGFSLAAYIFNVESGQKLITINNRVGDLAYSPDGRQLLVNTWDNNDNRLIKIFDPATGRELRNFTNGDNAVAFSPDGRRILTNSVSFRLRLDRPVRYGASYATFLDATTGRVTGTIGYGPLNVGARAYADLQIARYLNDTAAVNRHETVLQFITGRGNATRAQIETFYRDNIRALISQIVDEEFNYRHFLMPVPPNNLVINVYLSCNPQNGYYTLSYNRVEQRVISAPSLEELISALSRITADFNQASIDSIRRARFPSATVPVATVTYVKDSLTNFFTTPNQANFNILKNISTAANEGREDRIDNGLNIIEMRGVLSDLLNEGLIDRNTNIQNILTRNEQRRRVLNVPNDADIDWNDFVSAYGRILNNLNTELVRRM